jgi:hypothetical protein
MFKIVSGVLTEVLVLILLCFEEASSVQPAKGLSIPIKGTIYSIFVSISLGGFLQPSLIEVVQDCYEDRSNLVFGKRLEKYV